ncbi:MAG: winged helix-turn-helix transcriptional regulator [candidate division WOR-3 bacterium]|nr:MAG: winged helix-turn-helix transcriptional regulator [candidate division WOR-3 bacterium]UCF05596.1 MAG: winged helix-turn-helix transcriptional regulator [bacterium]
MAEKDKHISRLVELIFKLRKKCTLKDLFLVKKVGISYAEYNCLIQFNDADTIGMKELAARLDITPAGVTRIVSSLDERGIVERRIDRKDRREINVVLTRKGKRIVQDIHQASLDLHREIVKHINPKDCESIIQGIEQLTNAVAMWLDRHKEKELKR